MNTMPRGCFAACIILGVLSVGATEADWDPVSPTTGERTPAHAGIIGTLYSPAELDSVIEEAMATDHIPGMVLLITNQDEIVYTREYGWANIADSIPATDTTLFILASISKTFVANAAMQLWELGVLDIDANISDYLPFAVTNPYYPDSIMSTRMLLAHTASLRPDDKSIGAIVHPGEDSPIPLSLYLANYLVPGGSLYADTNFFPQPPGHVWAYSNHGFALIALIVEELSGQPFEAYCQTHLFDTLGMDEASWFVSGIANVDNIATGYRWNGANYTTFGNYGLPIYPCGMLRTSAVHLAKHQLAFMNYGITHGIRILDSATVALMRTPQFPDAGGSRDAQGLGWYEQLRADWDDRWGHGGTFYGSGTRMFFHPVERTGWIMLSNKRLDPEDPNGGHNIVQDAVSPFARDQDLDQAISGLDNCPLVANANQAITITMTGDVNVSGDLTSADIILMVNFVFKGGAEPQPCQASADVNCSGDVTSADIIHMVNHVFKGGAPPCNVCLDAPLGWTCP